MQDCLSTFQSLKRPRLLMRAANIGAKDYRRNIHLPRLLGYGRLPSSGDALMQLMDLERGLDALRTQDAENYPLLRHVEVLIAMLGEARAVQAAIAQHQEPLT